MHLTLIDFFIFSVGFLAQFLFAIRSLIQWFSTEKAGKVISPLIYWQIGLIAAFLMIVYGALRKDPAIILGEFITFYIYIRNLQIQGEWQKIPRYFRYTVPLLPVGYLAWIFFFGNNGGEQITGEGNMKSWLMIFGIAAQVIFSFRFVYQWLIAEKTRKSDLPLGFWYFSLIGGMMTIFYAILRRDPVLFLANCSGAFMYLRNLIVHYTGRGIFQMWPFDSSFIKNFRKPKDISLE
jgi:lipid-A-disaccharide synthase-like uncharacterized protein